MFDIALYGHLVLDTINDGRTKEFNFGGIGNVWRSLKEINSQLDIFVSPIYIGNSFISVDREQSQRSSKSNLNRNYFGENIQPAKINHICYINELDNLDFIKHLTGIICADICTGRKLKNEYLQYVDYLFVSEEDLDHIDNLALIRKHLIIHSPTKSYIHNISKSEVTGEFIDGLNVLGAGDHFASCFMHGLLNSCDVQTCLKTAHQQTTQYLKEKNGKT